MTLVKARLLDVEHLSSSNHPNHIVFMFNPTQLKFSRTMDIDEAPSTDEDGNNKISFKKPKPYTLTINEILIDTYEDQTSVLKHVEKFARAVRFLEEGNEKGKRPPIYVFTWGAINYIRCFVQSFNFDLTMFLPNGTPVRAQVTLTLKQVDPPNPNQSQGPPSISRAMRSAFGRESFL